MSESNNKFGNQRFQKIFFDTKILATTKRHTIAFLSSQHSPRSMSLQQDKILTVTKY